MEPLEEDLIGILTEAKGFTKNIVLCEEKHCKSAASQAPENGSNPICSHQPADRLGIFTEREAFV
jgi:hypothetical protein